MKAYKLTGLSSDNSRKVQQIVTAKADIAKAKSRLNVVYGVKKAEIQVDEIEIPTTKHELVDFINTLITESQE